MAIKVAGGHRQIAAVIELLVNKGRRPDSPRYVKVSVKDVDIICAGINHMCAASPSTWKRQFDEFRRG